MEKYEPFHHLLTNERGEAGLLCCHKELRPSRLSVEDPEGVEVIWVRTVKTTGPRQTASIIYFVLYHPTRFPYRDGLVTHIINTSDYLSVKHPCARLVLCGGFNEIDTTGIHSSHVVDSPTHGRNTLLSYSDRYDWLVPTPTTGATCRS